MLGDLRRISGLWLLETTDALWLRSEHQALLEAAEIRRLPADARYLVTDAEKLIPLGQRVPVASLPGADADWFPLSEIVLPDLGGSALPPEGVPTVPLQVVRTKKMFPCCGLQTSLAEWQRYGESASAYRLAALRFAVCDDQRVLILGQPLPPIPGTELTGENGLLVPACWWFDQPLAAEVLPTALKLGKGSVALFDLDGHWEFIRRDAFVPASRSAIRQSGAGQSSGGRKRQGAGR